VARPAPRLVVGVSGWQYDGWRGDFYPDELAARHRLSHLAERLGGVEVNATFYRLQRPETFRRWREETPDGFVFAVKGSRYITHMKALQDVDRGLANFFASGVLGLQDRLGPLLWQLPARMEFDEGTMRRFLDALPRTAASAADLASRHDRLPESVDVTSYGSRRLRHAVEPRHPGFENPRFLDLLRERRTALVISDAPDWPMLDHVTTDLVYVRLHGHTELYASGYASSSLDRWAGRCRDWLAEGREVHVYFDNDARGRAPHDACGLARRLGVQRDPE
jgi:uncharacterized protein YecE (DUF72 family)